MYWRATLKDGNIVRHLVDGDKHVSHHHLNPDNVTLFEVVEGVTVLWRMDKLPRNLRRRTMIATNGRQQSVYVLVLPCRVDVVFADGRVASVPDFLPNRHELPGHGVDTSYIWDGSQWTTRLAQDGDGMDSEGRVVRVKANGSITVNGIEVRNGWPCFTQIYAHPHSEQHHQVEQELHLRPDKPQ